MAPAKAAGALLTIGEVAAATGIAQHVLRYWEERLPQLQPVKRAGGRRYYRPEDVALLRQVEQLIERDGYTLDGAARALRRMPVAAPRPQAISEPDTRVPGGSRPADLAALQAIRDRLARAIG